MSRKQPIVYDLATLADGTADNNPFVGLSADHVAKSQDTGAYEILDPVTGEPAVFATPPGTSIRIDKPYAGAEKRKNSDDFELLLDLDPAIVAAFDKIVHDMVSARFAGYASSLYHLKDGCVTVVH